ncbi:MAG: hypothetical protein WD971_04130 [Pirellulales bacterium]
MPQAQDIFGTAFKNGSAILMARIVDAAGANVQQAGLAAIEYSIYELDPCRPDNLAAVAGHDGVSLVVADVIFNALQTGGLWTVDDVGYNFRHEIDVSTTEAFPKAGAQYQVRYELTPTAGQKTIVRFQLRVI